MFSEEWPLFIFTLLGQLAVGTWIVALSLRKLITKKINQDLASKLTGHAILLVGPTIALGLLVSFFHLGNPMLAYGAIANLGSSWLSREILLSGLFFLLWIATYYLIYRKANAANIVGWLTAIVGILSVFSMASAYHFASIPAWATINTYISFFATTIVLGSITTATLVCLSAKGSNLEKDILKLLLRLSFFALAAVVIQLIFVGININDLQTGIVSAQTSAQLQLNDYFVQLIFHGVFGLVGALLFVIMLYRNIKKETVVLPISVFYLAFLVILVGESLGRYLFYASAVPMNIG